MPIESNTEAVCANVLTEGAIPDSRPDAGPEFWTRCSKCGDKLKVKPHRRDMDSRQVYCHHCYKRLRNTPRVVALETPTPPTLLGRPELTDEQDLKRPKETTQSSSAAERISNFGISMQAMRQTFAVGKLAGQPRSDSMAAKPAQGPQLKETMLPDCQTVEEAQPMATSKPTDGPSSFEFATAETGQLPDVDGGMAFLVARERRGLFWNKKGFGIYQRHLTRRAEKERHYVEEIVVEATQSTSTPTLDDGMLLECHAATVAEVATTETGDLSDAHVSRFALACDDEIRSPAFSGGTRKPVVPKLSFPWLAAEEVNFATQNGDDTEQMVNEAVARRQRTEELDRSWAETSEVTGIASPTEAERYEEQRCLAAGQGVEEATDQEEAANNLLRIAAAKVEAENQVREFLKSRRFKNNVNSKKRRYVFWYRYPLHVAVREQDAKMVKLLLMAGADKSLKNSSGKTPAQKADKHSKLRKGDSVSTEVLHALSS